MKKSRMRILRQIGIGIKEAEFNRLKQDAPKIVRTELPVITLRWGRVLPSGCIEADRLSSSSRFISSWHSSSTIYAAKEEILLDFARELNRSNLVRWQIADDGNPIPFKEVYITGELRVVKPEDH